MSNRTPAVEPLRKLVMHSGITQERVALTMGMDPAAFSRIIRGLRVMPADFEPRLRATLDLLLAAERAADEARRLIMEQE